MVISFLKPLTIQAPIPLYENLVVKDNVLLLLSIQTYLEKKIELLISG